MLEYKPTFRAYHDFFVPQNKNERVAWLEYADPGKGWDRLTAAQTKGAYIRVRKLWEAKQT